MSSIVTAPFSIRNQTDQRRVDGDFPHTARIGLLHLLYDLVDKRFVPHWAALSKELRRIAQEHRWNTTSTTRLNSSRRRTTFTRYCPRFGGTASSIFVGGSIVTVSRWLSGDSTPRNCSMRVCELCPRSRPLRLRSARDPKLGDQCTADLDQLLPGSSLGIRKHIRCARYCIAVPYAHEAQSSEDPQSSLLASDQREHCLDGY